MPPWQKRCSGYASSRCVPPLERFVVVLCPQALDREQGLGQPANRTVQRSVFALCSSGSGLIRIDDDAPAERLQIRCQAALQICEPLLRGHPWGVVSLAPGLE